MKVYRSSASVALMLVVVSCSVYDPAQTNPELVSEASSLTRLAVMPPWVYVNRSTVKGRGGAYDMSVAMEALVEDVTSEALSRFGFELVGNGVDENRLRAAPEIMYEFCDLQETFAGKIIMTGTEGLTGEIVVIEHRIERGEYRLGLAVIPFARDAGADALVFIHGHGTLFSESKKAVNMASNLLSGAISETDNEFYYKMMIVNGADGVVMTAVVSKVKIDYLACSQCYPGQPGFEEGMARFGKDLESDMLKKLAVALGRDPS